ncbi:MAG: DUF1775 domain-containing protein [Hyphomicrobiaceae bacterium]
MWAQMLKAAVGFAIHTLLATALSAHPSLQPKEAAVGSSYRAVVSIPHGCSGSSTLKVRVKIPEGVIGVKPMLKSGWSISTVRGPYERSYPYYHGQTLTEGVKEIIWSGTLPDDVFDEFVFTGFFTDILQEGTTLYFPTYQECANGALQWIETPKANQDGHALAAPAPGVRLLPTAQTTTKSYRKGSIVVEAPWTRATPGGAQVAAGYLRVTNTGKEIDRLVGATSPIATAVEVHEMSSNDGIMKMRRLENGLIIAPSETVELTPGGKHLMFTGLREALKVGGLIRGQLTFEKAGTIDIEFSIAPSGAQSAGHSHH